MFHWSWESFLDSLPFLLGMLCGCLYYNRYLRLRRRAMAIQLHDIKCMAQDLEVRRKRSDRRRIRLGRRISLDQELARSDRLVRRAQEYLAGRPERLAP